MRKRPPPRRSAIEELRALGAVNDLHDDEVPRSRASHVRPAPGGGGIEIQIGVDISRMASQATEALGADPETFQRSGSLVRVARVANDEESRRSKLPVGAPMIVPMSQATLKSRLSKLARWTNRSVRDGEVRWIGARPDTDAVAAVLDARAWPGIPVLAGVTDTPFLRPDGSVAQAAGYDAMTGFLFVPTDTFPTVADAPSADDARDALAQLTEVFADFPFATDAARMVPVAALLTVLARPAIDGSVPLFGMDATTRGSGKTLCADAFNVIATGRASRTTVPTKEEEFRKVLDGYALQGVSTIVLDNVAGPFGGAALDAYITARDTVDCRILGRTGQVTVPWRGLLCITGNNLSPTGDTIRRMVVARLEPQCERPEDRDEFRHRDLLGYVRAARPRLVAAALTVLRAYYVAEQPDQRLGTWGSFEAWARLIPPAIVFAGGANVLDARLTHDGERDDDVRALETIVTRLPALGGDPRGLRVRDIIDALYPADRRRGEAAPDGFEDLRDAIEALVRSHPGKPPSTRQIGDAFKKFRGRYVAGRRLVGAADSHTKVMRWRIEELQSAGSAGTSGVIPIPSLGPDLYREGVVN